MLQFRKKAIFLVCNSLLLFFIINGCNRNTPVENIDDGIAPAKPTGLNLLYAYDGEIGFSWSPNLENDIEFYKIYKAQKYNTNYIEIDSTSDLYFIDTYLKYDSTYFYKISAVDEFGSESNLSDSVFGLPQNLYRPLPPYYLSVNGRNWDDSITVKIMFAKSYSSDVKYYEIHRSTIDQFTPDSTTFIAATTELIFTDRANLDLLKNYYYKIISVDKGNLRSTSSIQQGDILLDKPTQIFPQNNQATNYFVEFKIKTCSESANYKIAIQSNEIYGTETELDFSSKLENTIISVPIKDFTFSPYSEYYWRVFAYTKGNNIPNSYSELYKFTIVPGE